MRTFLLLAFLAAFGLISCQQEKPPVEKAASDAAKTATGVAASVSTAAEIACAHCVYHTAGVTACAPAVKVGGQTLLLSGGNVDVKASKLCEAAKKCTLEGKVDGGKYVATKVTVQ